MWLSDIPNGFEGTLIDVRTQEEYELNHAPGAVNIPMGRMWMDAGDIDKMPRPLVLYCNEGLRSGWAILVLRMLGLKDLYNGGGWVDVTREIKNREALLG